MRKPLALLFAFAVALCARDAFAQERGQVGVTMGYPQSIGVVWHITDTIAVRPDLFFQHTSIDNLGDQSSTTTGLGISGIVYLMKEDALRTYVTPRFTYNRVTSEISTSLAARNDILATFPIGLTIPSSIDTTTVTKSFSGSIGAQYSLHKKFSVFGEVGVRYQWADRPDFSGFGSLPIELPSSGPKAFGTTSAAGVILYFK